MHMYMCVYIYIHIYIYISGRGGRHHSVALDDFLGQRPRLLPLVLPPLDHLHPNVGVGMRNEERESERARETERSERLVPLVLPSLDHLWECSRLGLSC